MVQKQQIENTNTPNTVNTISQLERFNIGFEYDKTFQQVKRETRLRTLSNKPCSFDE